jgi:hypothetical protein
MKTYIHIAKLVAHYYVLGIKRFFTGLKIRALLA